MVVEAATGRVVAAPCRGAAGQQIVLGRAVGRDAGLGQEAVRRSDPQHARPVAQARGVPGPGEHRVAPTAAIVPDPAGSGTIGTRQVRRASGTADPRVSGRRGG
jgi:hypothetical protein